VLLAFVLALAGNTLGLVAISPHQLEMLTNILPTGMLSGGLATAFTSSLVNGGYGLPSYGFGKLFGTDTASSARVEMTPRFAKLIPGSKTVKLRYGPYKVPNMMKKNGLGEAGSLWNYPDTNVGKPCTGNCVVVGMTAGLEYADGTNANIDSGIWLHHMVLFNIGKGRVDQTCSGAWSSVPHADVGCTPETCERLFASGNERTPALPSNYQTGPSDKAAGYFLRANDKFALIIDLMNDSDQDKTVYMTMVYDYVDGWPTTLDHYRPVWLDVDECGISEVEAAAQKGAYTIRAKPWRATLDGQIIGYGGHVHDGGVRVNMLVNGVKDCSSEATYGATDEFKSKGVPMMNKNSATVHISNMTVCSGPKLANKYMKKGQLYTITADYDYNQYKGMLDGAGGQESVMGIAIMFVRQPPPSSGWSL